MKTREEVLAGLRAAASYLVNFPVERVALEEAIVFLEALPPEAGAPPRAPHEEEVHRNYEAFKRLLPSLLPLHRGQYALMRGGEILDFYGTCAAGYAAGVERYGPLAPEVPGWSLQKVTDEPVCVYSASAPQTPPPLGYQGELHVYSPEEWHGEAFIVGTEPALVALRSAVDKAIRDGRGAMMSFTSDGEGFAGLVIRAAPEEMPGLLLPYVGEVAKDCSRDPALKHPWDLLKPREYRTLLEEAGHEPFDRPPVSGGGE